MKKTVLFVVILLTGLISLSIYATVRNGQNGQDGTITTATVQPEESILGTWQLIEADHVKVTDKKQLKHFTDSHFSWEQANEKGVIHSGASGTYSIAGDSLFENIEMGSPGMQRFIGTTGRIAFKIADNKLHINGVMANGFNYSETWVRAK